MQFLQRTTLVLLGIGLVATLAACKVKATLFCDENTPCTTTELPFCDLDGEFPDSDGHGRTCIANPFDGGVIPCAASETVCTSDTLSVCDADGNLASQTDCPLGCHATELRCNKLDPSNGLAPHLDDAETEGADIILGDGATFNTSTGEVRNGDGSLVAVPSVLLPAPNGGVEVRVFKLRSLSIGDATISGVPAIAIVSAGDIEILGTVVVEPGAGTMHDVANCVRSDEQGAAGTAPGAGGAGFGTNGGDGGAGNGGVGITGGQPSGNQQLVPLRGGCTGVAVCSGTCFCVPAACPIDSIGGGSIQIATAGSLFVGRASFTASLEAHASGPAHRGQFNAGIGGGSGGGLLLEAAEVVVDAFAAIAANGAGGTCFGQPAGAGTTLGTANGATCTDDSGDGGNGATRGRTAQNGDAGTGTGAGGGGGGGLGRIRINTRGRIFDEAGTLSPQPFVGEVRVR